MTYSVETWDDDHHCVRYHEIVHAIDYEDAEQIVKDLHPDQKILSVIKRKNHD